MDEVERSDGYILGPNRTPEDVLAVADDLLRSEGIDPEWPRLQAKRSQATKPPS
jgi:hypothetical protein